MSTHMLLKLTGLGWSFDDIPSQDLDGGKRAVCTGANSGIGFETCRRLLEHDLGYLVMASRHKDLVEQAAQDLQEEFPSARISAMHLNLEDFGSVRSFADKLMKDDKPIHLLINAAGRYIDTPFAVTKDGFEVQMEVNYYGPVYLTHLLLPKIVRSGSARIVNVSSMAEMFGKLDWDDLRGTELGTSGIAAYGRSKLFFLMYSLELQRRLNSADLQGSHVKVFATHPGLVSTALMNKVDFRHPFVIISFAADVLFGLSPVKGSMSTLYAATKPGLRGGQYIGPSYIFNTWTTLSGPPWNPAARDPRARARLYDATLDILQEATGSKLCRVVPGQPVA